MVSSWMLSPTRSLPRGFQTKIQRFISNKSFYSCAAAKGLNIFFMDVGSGGTSSSSSHHLHFLKVPSPRGLKMAAYFFSFFSSLYGIIFGFVLFFFPRFRKKRPDQPETVSVMSFYFWRWAETFFFFLIFWLWFVFFLCCISWTLWRKNPFIFHFFPSAFTCSDPPRCCLKDIRMHFQHFNPCQLD